MRLWRGLGVWIACVVVPLAAASQGVKSVPTGAAGRLAPPALVAQLEARGAETRRLGARGGLEGYLVRLAEGGVYTLYLTADGHAVMGVLYGPDGAELTGAQVAAVQTVDMSGESVAKIEGSVAAGEDPDEQRFRELAAAAGFVLGDKGQEVVVFGDPLCRWSRSTVARLGHAALEGGVKLQVVPVGVLGAESVRRAAAVLGSGSPGLAWFKPGAAAVTADGERLVAANNELFAGWGEEAVPLVLYRASSGRIGRHVGSIEDVAVWLNGLAK